MTNMLWVNSAPKNLNTNALSAGANLAKPGSRLAYNGGGVGSDVQASYNPNYFNYGNASGDSAGNGGDPNNGAPDMSTMSMPDLAAAADTAGNYGGIAGALGVPGAGMLGMLTASVAQDSLEAQVAAINEETPFSLDVGEISAMSTNDRSGGTAAGGIDNAVNNPDTVGTAPTTGMPTNAEVGDPSTGSGESDSVICTELHRRGLMSDKMYAADGLFLRTVEPSVVAGYHAWARPVARLMRKSDTFASIINLFAKHWAEHMAFSVGAFETDNQFGRFLNNIGQPLCKAISHLNRPVKALS